MALGGAILVELSATLADIAREMGTTVTALSAVYLTRGAGAVAGAMFSARMLYQDRDGYVARGHRVIVATELLLAAQFVAAPFVRSPVALHALWFGVGACTATLDTGCQVGTPRDTATTRGHGDVRRAVVAFDWFGRGAFRQRLPTVVWRVTAAAA